MTAVRRWGADPHLTRLDDPHGKLPDIEAELVFVIAQATHQLPPGWRVEVAECQPLPLAIDLQLIDDKGRRLASRCRQQNGPIYETYRRFADLVFAAQQDLCPKLEGRLAWGGKFTTADGQWQVGYFDLGGFRGRGRYTRPPSRSIHVAS